MAAIGIGGLATPAAAQDKRVTVLMFGSTWERVFKPVADAFKKETGITIVPVIENTSIEGLAKIQAMRNRPEVDVWFTNTSTAVRAATDRELFVPLPRDKIPNLDKVIPGGVDEMFVAYWYFPLGIVYRPDLVPGGKVTAWSDLWAPAFRNKVALPAPTVYPGRTLLIASLLNGGSIDNIEPGLQLLDRVKGNVAMFHGSDTQARRALAQGEVWAMLGSPSAVKELQGQNIPVTMATPRPTPLIFEGMMMVKSGNEAAAAVFINKALTAEWQKHMTEVYNLGPIHRDVAPAASLEGLMPKPEDRATFDEATINARLGQWTERFNTVVAR